MPKYSINFTLAGTVVVEHDDGESAQDILNATPLNVLTKHISASDALEIERPVEVDSSESVDEDVQFFKSSFSAIGAPWLAVEPAKARDSKSKTTTSRACDADVARTPT
jgi:hypothetical protein